MAASITIVDSCVYIPDQQTPVEQVIWDLGCQGVSLRMQEEEYKTSGFRYIPEEQICSLEEMIYRVSAPLLTRAAESGLRVQAIVFASVTNPIEQARNLFMRLLHEFSLEEVPVLKLEEYGCATFHLYVYLSKGFLTGVASEDEAILFVTADKARNGAERSDTFMIFGDAASAALCKSNAKHGHQVLASGLKADGIAYDSTPERIKMYFSTFYLSVRQVVNQVLRESGTTMHQISLILCTNLGLDTWSILAKALGCSMELFYTDTLGKMGHLHNTDILLNIEEAVSSGRLRKGDLYLAITVGFGGYYGCSLHQYE